MASLPLHYIIQRFLSCSTSEIGKKHKKSVSINSLQQHASGKKGKVTTLQLHQLLPEDASTLRQVEKQSAPQKEKAL